MTRFLAMDYGLERIGVAISDPEGRMAFPLHTLMLKDCGSRSAQLDAFVQLSRDYQAQAVVVGLPLHGDGSESDMAQKVRKIAARLQRRMDLPIFFMPEYLSSEEARQDLQERGIRGARMKKLLDCQAACRILESFLSQAEEKRLPG